MAFKGIICPRSFWSWALPEDYRRMSDPKGPEIEMVFQDRPPGLKLSSEIGKFNPRPPSKPNFLWGILKVKIENSKEIVIFERD